MAARCSAQTRYLHIRTSNRWGASTDELVAEHFKHLRSSQPRNRSSTKGLRIVNSGLICAGLSAMTTRRRSASDG